jgi:hypothetical protein
MSYGSGVIDTLEVRQESQLFTLDDMSAFGTPEEKAIAEKFLVELSNNAKVKALKESIDEKCFRFGLIPDGIPNEKGETGYVLVCNKTIKKKENFLFVDGRVYIYSKPTAATSALHKGSIEAEALLNLHTGKLASSSNPRFQKKIHLAYVLDDAYFINNCCMFFSAKKFPNAEVKAKMIQTADPHGHCQVLYFKARCEISPMEPITFEYYRNVKEGEKKFHTRRESSVVPQNMVKCLCQDNCPYCIFDTGLRVPPVDRVIYPCMKFCYQNKTASMREVKETIERKMDHRNKWFKRIQDRISLSQWKIPHFKWPRYQWFMKIQSKLNKA